MLSVSIIIPNLNSLVIDKTLASLRRQIGDVTQVEVLVVGRDEPSLVEQDALVRLIDTHQPVPPAKARNIGIKHAKGKLLFFLDADCVVVSGWLEQMLAYFEDPQVDIVGGGVRFPQGGYWERCDDVANFYPYTSDAPVGTRDLLPTINLGVRREVVERVGLLDEDYSCPAGEDADWTIRMRQKGYDLHFAPEATVIHQHDRASLRALLHHAECFGYYSTKVTPKYWDVLQIPFFLRHSLLLLLSTPTLAFLVTAQILLRPHMWHYWYTWPGVFLSKLAWCWGAFQRLRELETHS
jgi:GT2 family glycosyltransferase